ncbi:MAG: hypothetical protein RIR70_963, partial [Pseudomonadota bacterium]
RARQEPHRCKVVDASGMPDEVWAQVERVLQALVG